jgi:hypothetical protein
VVASDPPLASAQSLDAPDGEHIRADAFYLGAERGEEPAEILDVRLARGVADHGLALRQRRRHEGVLRRHHARLVEEDPLATEAVSPHFVAAVHLDQRPELGQRVDVRVEPTSADHVAAGRRNTCAAGAGKQGTRKQERGPNPARELFVDLAGRQLGRLHANFIRAAPVGIHAELGEQANHRLDVPDSRHIGQRHRLVRQQAGSEDGQRSILVPGRGDAAVQALGALDDERLHERLGDSSRRHLRGYRTDPWRRRANRPGRR